MLLNEMEIFYYVVEWQSFSKAADYLGVSKSFISKHISQLEQHLKTRLLTRSTRTLILTEAGQAFYQQCVKVIAEAQRGYDTLSELQGKPKGTLKISAPPALVLNLLAPFLPKFLRQYPDIILDIQLENQIVDMIKGGYDLALRSAVLTSSNLIAQTLFMSQNVICAAPSYLQRHGTPKHPIDLNQHYFALYNYTKASKQITLKKGRQQETIVLRSNFMTNQLDLTKKMLLSDCCMAVMPKFMVCEEFKKNLLVRCLSDYELPASPIYAIYPERDFMPPKLKVFLQMLKDFLKKNEKSLVI